MKLWVESACKAVPEDAGAEAGVASTLTTEDRFVAAMVGGRPMADRRQPTAHSRQAKESSYLLCQRFVNELASGVVMDTVVGDVLAALPAGEHVPVALLRIGRDGRAGLAEIDAPPLFMARKGDFILLPVVEEEQAGRLVRRCDFTVQAGDHLALVSESYLGISRAARSWSWRDVALSVRRLTSTGCDAEQLAGALVRIANQRSGESTNQRINESTTDKFIILALFVRPMRTATVWSGPPADRRRDHEALARLMAEEGVRIICGDTTAQLAARLLNAELRLDPRPAAGWREVPPTARLITPDGASPLALVTEGLITMRTAADRLAAVKRPNELLGRNDGASRLAKLLLEADKVTFLVGLAVNPAQVERDGTPLRKAAVLQFAEALKARGKIVAVEYM